MTDIRDEVAAALAEQGVTLDDIAARLASGYAEFGHSLMVAVADVSALFAVARGLTVVREELERVRTEYQRFYDFVGEADPALVDAWHFTENVRAQAEARLARQPEGQREAVHVHDYGVACIPCSRPECTRQPEGQ